MNRLYKNLLVHVCYILKYICDFSIDMDIINFSNIKKHEMQENKYIRKNSITVVVLKYCSMYCTIFESTVVLISVLNNRQILFY